MYYIPNPFRSSRLYKHIYKTLNFNNIYRPCARLPDRFFFRSRCRVHRWHAEFCLLCWTHTHTDVRKHTPIRPINKIPTRYMCRYTRRAVRETIVTPPPPDQIFVRKPKEIISSTRRYCFPISWKQKVVKKYAKNLTRHAWRSASKCMFLTAKIWWYFGFLRSD